MTTHITYGDPIWRTDAEACFREAERRINIILSDKQETHLFLSDLYALKTLPETLSQCKHISDLDIGDAKGPDDKQYSHPGWRSIVDIDILSELTGLEKLNLNYSKVSDLSPVSGLTALQNLNCSGTEVSDLTPVSGLTALQSVDCGGTQVSDLSPVSGLTALQNLNCSGTEVSDLTPVSGLTALQSVDCGGTQVSDLSPVSGLTALQNLNCSETQVSDLSPVSGLTALQSLYCSSTYVSDLAPLATLTALQSLQCSHTQVSDFAPLATLTALQFLSFWNTRISDLTPLATLTALQTLNCSRTQVSDLAPLATLTALQTLNCSHTQVSDFAPLATLTALQSLQCSHTQVSDFAPLATLTALQTLNCSHTQVSDLAPLATLTALQSLQCSHTQVSDLAPLATLTALQTLNCSHTQVSDLAPLATLTALQTLNCSRTQVSDLTPLATLTALQSLFCINTPVSDLAPLATLTALRSLHCSDTQVCDLTPLEDHMALRRLSISNCSIMRLPDFGTKFLDLAELNAKNTSFPGIPQEVLSDGLLDDCLPRLRAHLADLGDDPEPLNDIKLMVLGNGRIGKTQICNRLRGQGFDADADSTHGITLDTAPIPGRPDEDPALFNIWDFGGQDIYHGTHALFLKSRAIFLLVWTPESDTSETHTDAHGMVFRNQPLGWWLDYVRRFGNESSPLIVVQNQIDRMTRVGEHDAVTAFKIDNPVGEIWSIAYSAKTMKGHGTLLDTLSQASDAFNPPLIGAGRRQMIDRLRDMRQADSGRAPKDRQYRTLSFDDFESLCAETGQICDARLFLEFLHNAGEIFWREGHFGNQIIIDQEWVLEAIYAVFKRDSCVRTLTAQGGRFSASLLDALVWNAKGYDTDDQTLFIDFMKTSGMCFSLGWQSDMLIAPDYLPIDPPRRRLLSFEPQSSVTLDFDSLPPILMRNVISRIGQEAGANAEYWRHGILFYDIRTRSKVRIEQTLSADWAGTVRIDCADGDHKAAQNAVAKVLYGECQRLGISPTEPPDDPARIRDAEPDDDAKTGPETLSPGPDPTRPREYYVSYAWDKEGMTPPDKLTRIVDDLCKAADDRGIHIHRDKNELKFGSSIGEFMQRLMKGDRIIVVLSPEYLRSRNCMTELYGIYLEAQNDDQSFLEKVRVFMHEGTEIGSPAARGRIAQYWRLVYEEEVSVLEDMGESDRVKNLALKKFQAEVGNILALISDRLHPRTIDDLTDHAFDD